MTHRRKRTRRTTLRRLALLALAGLVGLSALTPTRARQDAGDPWADEVIYFVMTDRFANGDRANDTDARPRDPRAYHGGDLKGLTEKLDYIASLGVTAIWITPVVDNVKDGYHGYWAADFERVDEHLGTMEDLRLFVSEARQRGLKVLLDVVVNHVGYGAPWTTDPTKAAWFNTRGDIRNWSDQTELEEGRLAGLPDLNQRDPEVARYLIDNALWWIDQTGVAGFRLDTVRHVPKDFWRQYTAAIKARYPDFFFIGEAWDSRYDYLDGYQATGIDAMIDFARYEAIGKVFGKEGDASVLLGLEAVQRQTLRRPFYLGTFIDNHDVPRFVWSARSPGEGRLRAALGYLLTAPGIPILYYGTEVALSGGPDPLNRRDMAFGANPELTEWVSRLVRLRRENVALRRGEGRLLRAGVGVVAILRTTAEQRALVLINNGPVPRTARPAGENLRLGSRLIGLLSPDRAVVSSRLAIELAPFEVRIYDVRPPTALGRLFGAPQLAAWLLGAAVAGAVYWLWRRRLPIPK